MSTVVKVGLGVAAVATETAEPCDIPGTAADPPRAIGMSSPHADSGKRSDPRGRANVMVSSVVGWAPTMVRNAAGRSCRGAVATGTRHDDDRVGSPPGRVGLSAPLPATVLMLALRDAACDVKENPLAVADRGRELVPVVPLEAAAANATAAADLGVVGLAGIAAGGRGCFGLERRLCAGSFRAPALPRLARASARRAVFSSRMRSGALSVVGTPAPPCPAASRSR